MDINFASLDTLENMSTYTKSLRAKAREEYDRDISTMTYGLVVVRDTEKEAKAAFQSVIDHGDWDAAGNVMKVAGMESQSFNEQIKQFQERFIAGWAGYPVVGSPEQVVEELGRLNEAGMDGMIMGFVDYNEEMKYFGEKVMPLMKEAGGCGTEPVPAHEGGKNAGRCGGGVARKRAGGPGWRWTRCWPGPGRRAPRSGCTSWPTPRSPDAVAALGEADAAVFGSPTYRADITAQLKGLLDATPRGAAYESGDPLRGTVCATVLTGASDHHFLAVEKVRGILGGFFGAQLLSPGPLPALGRVHRGRHRAARGTAPARRAARARPGRAGQPRSARRSGCATCGRSI